MAKIKGQGPWWEGGRGDSLPADALTLGSLHPLALDPYLPSGGRRGQGIGVDELLSSGSSATILTSFFLSTGSSGWAGTHGKPKSSQRGRAALRGTGETW